MNHGETAYGLWFLVALRDRQEWRNRCANRTD